MKKNEFRINHAYELLSLDGEEFVEACYLVFLGRTPEKNGLNYYLGRLSDGVSKKEVIRQIFLSSNNSDALKIIGVKSFIKSRWISHFLCKFTSSAIQNRNQYYLAKLSNSINKITEQLDKKTYDTFDKINKVDIPTIGNVTLERYYNVVNKVRMLVESDKDIEGLGLASLPDKLNQLPQSYDFFFVYFTKVEL